MTDPNDYIVTANPNRVPLVEMRYLFGQQEPEMFIADNPLAGQMFSGDRTQYKIRHEYGGVAPEWRAFHKAVVA